MGQSENQLHTLKRKFLTVISQKDMDPVQEQTLEKVYCVEGQNTYVYKPKQVFFIDFNEF